MAHLGEFGRALNDHDQRPTPADTYTFHGDTFTIPEDLSVLPSLRFAHAHDEVRQAGREVEARLAAATTDDERHQILVDDAEAAARFRAETYRFIQAMIAPGEWERFEQAADRAGASRDELLDVAHMVAGVVAARPRMRSTGSPSGPSGTGGGSLAGSTSPQDSNDTGGTDGPSELERARAEIAQVMVPVGEAVRSRS